jgi:phospholipase/carboxylesterase
MNRIQQYFSDAMGPDSAGMFGDEVGEFASPANALGLDSSVESGRFHAGAPGASHWMFVPLHYEPNYAYPLIVWLHGPQDDERQLKRIMPFISMRNYVAVAPRGTLNMAEKSAGCVSDTAAPGAGGVRADGSRAGCCWSQTEDHILLAEHRVLEAVSAARRQLNISPQRIFLAGYGCGGTMAFRLALNLPQVFAGAVSLGGSFPTGMMPLAQLNYVRRLKFLLASGRDSGRYPPEKVCENLRLIYAAGMSISLRQYPCGDDLTTHMLADVDRWIMQQIAAPVAASEDSAQPRAGGSAD